jgi:transcriptional regulator with XRE-family HTH domain
LLVPTAVKQQLALQLRQLRRAKGWSQEKLSEKASMHRTYLAGIERSLRNPSLENLIKLANALGVTMTELFACPETTSPTRSPKTATTRKPRPK